MLPFLTKKLGADAADYANLQATVAALMVIGGPLIGLLIVFYFDKIGK